MIKINLLKEIEKTKKKELESKEETSTPLALPKEEPKADLEKKVEEVKAETPKEKIVEKDNSADNFEDIEEKETQVENLIDEQKVNKIEEKVVEIDKEDTKISAIESQEEEEPAEEKPSPFRPIKFDTNASVPKPEETSSEPENLKEEQTFPSESETESKPKKEEQTEETVTTETKTDSETSKTESDSENEVEEESVLIDEEKPAVPFRVVESSIGEDDDEISYDDFADSKMPHILVAIAILAVIGVSAYYLWTINDEIVDPVADGTSTEYQEEMPSESENLIPGDEEITEIPQEENFTFDESATQIAESKEEETPIETFEPEPVKEEPKETEVSTPPVIQPTKGNPETTLTTSANVNFKKITLPNALILDRDVSAGEFKITCFAQKKFTRGVVAEFKKRGGYSQLNINVRTDIRDGKIGDLIVFSGKN